MTVNELIAELQKYDGDTIVSVSGYEDGYTDSFDVGPMTLAPNVHTEHYYGEHDIPYGKEDSLIDRVVIYR